MKPQHDGSLSMADKMALIPEPSQEARQASHELARAAQELTRLDRKREAYALLVPGTPVRLDIYGWRGHDVRVVSDDGPAHLPTRKIKLEKISGRNAGETTFASRDRVKPIPAAGV